MDDSSAESDASSGEDASRPVTGAADHGEADHLVPDTTPLTAQQSQQAASTTPPSLPASSLTFGSTLGHIESDALSTKRSDSSEGDEYVEVPSADDNNTTNVADTGSDVKTPEPKNKPLVPPDIFGSVAKQLEQAKQKMASSTNAGRRGSDFIEQVKKDFNEATGVKSSVSSALSSPQPDLSTSSDKSSPAASLKGKEQSVVSSKFVPKPALKLIRRTTSQEHAHSFHEHSYKAPTYCQICDGLLVGLWAQGFRCKHCGMDVHRGEGMAGHDDCRAEALMAPCRGPDTTRDLKREKESAKLGDVIAQIRELANNPNFIKEVTEQMDKDVKSRAKNVIVATAVEDERGKNLKRIKKVLVPFIHKIDATASGEIYALTVLLGLQALATIVQTVVSFGLFIVALAPTHGFMTETSLRLAAVNDATVTAALHVMLAILSVILYKLSSLFKRKANLIDRFCVDALRMNAEADLGISVAGAAERAKNWSKRILISSVLSMISAMLFWHHSQPTSWEASTLPPVANLAFPAFIFTICSGAVAYVSYKSAPAELSMEDYVDVKDEMVKDEVEIASKRSWVVSKGKSQIDCTPSLDDEKEDLEKDKDKDKDVPLELQDVLNDLVPSGAIIE